ncbi:hypothetical protein [Nonomuraea rubra]|uniref:hypothetical protein n=1 Tax=Nonomuraea rubra TaxID=46180 RepID=UPI00340A7AEA
MVTERNIDPDAMWYTNRLAIRFPYVPDTLSTDRHPHVSRTSPVRLRRAVEQICRQFDQETEMGVAYNASHPPGDHVTVVLIPSQCYLIGRARLMAGAIGVNARDYKGGPAAIWVYVDPYERGRGLIDEAWPHMLRSWPGLRFAGPFTMAGERLRDRLDAG